MRAHASAILLGLVLLSTGCERLPADPVMDPGAPALSNVSGEGAVLVRYDRNFLLVGVDHQQKLLAAHTSRNSFPACGQPVTEIHMAEVLDVISPEDEEIINQLLKGDGVTITVWSWAHLDAPSFTALRCTTPQWRGTGQVVLTDNDLLAFVGGHTRANAFGYTAQGDVWSADGVLHAYSAAQRIVWKDQSTVFHQVAQITIN